ncbi:MAG: hypothetical protein J6T08_05065 [Lentisphaeria bacterium]|nr:hypothetical protein [Lentisphaeria bacterium]
MFCADFETTVYSGQDHTEVWAAALVEMGTEDVKIFHSIDDFFMHVFSLLDTDHIKLYFHNLKFDGQFIRDYFLRDLQMPQALEYGNPDDIFSAEFLPDKKMQDDTFKYIISDMAEWYLITVKMFGHYLNIADSFKLLPFSLAAIGKSFQTKHQKLEMEYDGFRFAGCEITPQEAEYIKNDVLVMKEALEVMFGEGHNKLTIGSCCLAEFQELMGKWDYKDRFCDMSKVELDPELYGSKNADQYIRRAYRGGWCYLAKGKEGKVFHDGITLDVNSLYPSVMTGESGNVYPYGMPCFWKGDYIPEQATKPGRYYFIRVKCCFLLKEGYLPTIQIKTNPLYKKNEYLESSAIYLKGKRYKYAKVGNTTVSDQVTLTLTQTDWKLLQDHYILWNVEILDGCYFFACAGMFDRYIDKYKEIKMTSKGARRAIAKLFLNNLYGKMATGSNSSFKVAYLKNDDSIGYYNVPEDARKLVYIPVGAAVTAAARNYTIRAAQANYYGKNKPGFIYADTDSLHMDIPIEQVKGVTLHDSNFLCWKHEASWKRGLFLRQKTYIETDDESCNVTACGMGKRCKELIASAITGADPGELSEPEQEFMERFHKLEDFQIGLEVPSNLKQKRMKGGVVLMEDYFCIR